VRPHFFADLAAWRRWLEEHHADAEEISVGFWKRGTGKPSLTWPESVDGALCFGWIDGVRHSIDERRYRIRFTPRRPGSNWSAINVRRIEELIAAGQVHEAGLAAYRARTAEKTAVYAYERAHAAFAPEEERALRANRAAWAHWEKRAPSYRRVATYWVTSAKKPETRARRMATLIADAAAGLPFGQLITAADRKTIRSSPTPTGRARPAASRARPAKRRRSASTPG
jgi:uncharacterized protein YdeI (YjbR/CyaY-like superfamily)